MKNMRLLFFSSVIIAISAIGWAFYYNYTVKSRLAREAEVPLVENGEGYIPDAAAQAVTNFFLENSRAEDGVLYSVRHYPSDEVTVSESEVNSPAVEEICCPEDPGLGSTEESEATVLERKKSHYERVRAKLIAIRGDVPEVEAFIALGKKMSNREILTKDESLEHFRLMAFFHPSEGNIAAYEKWKEFHSVGDPDSYTMEHIDPPQGRLDTPPE